ncbi:hypothetical protein MIND_00967400 [Mycena indigotica]|uniref:F-box domain-containing protein n=1 Tax=Mycena indigotica TaxID=2126181 RepID=A0A8H6SGC7_9AGAR|nr:uncharacterized protein MIND_00967400 [Mycena indigotica]KAF7297340.1 hypothetical protein MIND_00967400 [Mycena indigotica]
MSVSIHSLSAEVLQNITLLASDTLGPPCEWSALTRCCHSFRRKLDVPAMHARLFSQKFQVPAEAHHLLPIHARDELQRRFAALNFFRKVESLGSAPAFTDALWVAYVMLKAEAPRQMNVDQLLWAGLPSLLLRYVQHHLVGQSHGWPAVNETTSLVVALLWLLSSEESVATESATTREAVMERIRPYVLAAFKYPVSSTPWRSTSESASSQGNFTSQLEEEELTVWHASAGTIVIAPTRQVHYFGQRTVHVPAVPIYSILCYFTRLDMLSPMFPVHLSAASPPKGPRREDVEHFIKECRTPFEPWNSKPMMNTSNDALSRSLNQPYFPGSLSGRWKGSSIIPNINDYMHWKEESEAPEAMETFCRQPLYLTLQEHFCYEPVQQEHCLPETWVEWEDEIQVESWSRTYKTHRGERPPQKEIFDVLVTGQTDDPYATAWGHFKFVGRIRMSDGLVVLRRESVAGLGTTILRGYMSSRQNFCGRYRAIDNGNSALEWEAAFSLCKMLD